MWSFQLEQLYRELYLMQYDKLHAEIVCVRDILLMLPIHHAIYHHRIWAFKVGKDSHLVMFGKD